jgi:hypothetical protein
VSGAISQYETFYRHSFMRFIIMFVVLCCGFCRRGSLKLVPVYVGVESTLPAMKGECCEYHLCGIIHRYFNEDRMR